MQVYWRIIGEKSDIKLPQITSVFFVEKKNGKKKMVQDYRYLNK